MEAVLSWLRPGRRAPLPRDILETLPPEMAEAIAGQVLGLRPLLRLAQVHPTWRDHVDRVFVFLFHRDIIDALEFPPRAPVSFKQGRDLVLADLSRTTYPPELEHKELELPYLFLYLYFGPREQYHYDLTTAREQKLALGSLYRTVCQHLAVRFALEVAFAHREAEESSGVHWIRLRDTLDPERDFEIVASPLPMAWLRRAATTMTLSVKATGQGGGPEMQRCLATFRQLAAQGPPTGSDLRVAWINAFMNLLLGVSTYFILEGAVPGAANLVRIMGLRTLMQTVILEVQAES